MGSCNLEPSVLPSGGKGTKILHEHETCPIFWSSAIGKGSVQNAAGWNFSMCRWIIHNLDRDPLQ